MENLVEKKKNFNKKTGFETDDIIQELLKLFCDRYQMGLKQSIKNSNFVYDGVD